MFSYLFKEFKSFEQSEPKHVNMYGLSPMDWLSNIHSYTTNTIKYLYIAVAKSNVFAPIISVYNFIDGGNY